MPSNPHKDEVACRRNLHNVLTKALPQAGELPYQEVVREALLQYPVSRRMVEQFIQDFYVAPGHVKLTDGTLYPVAQGGEE